MILSVLLACGAITLIAYLLWPTWSSQNANAPSTMPVSVGDTLFNIPSFALRRKIQRHSGPQDRIDLDFAYPSLGEPAARPRVTAQTAITNLPSIDLLFLSIATAEQEGSPDERVSTVYPRYLDTSSAVHGDGLTLTAFDDGTPYANEDLAVGDNPVLVARCTRDGGTPGMCMSERRIEGADLTFRFPRQWLSQWREVANAMDRLVTRLHRPHG